jgi:hypothetical protein
MTGHNIIRSLAISALGAVAAAAASLTPPSGAGASQSTGSRSSASAPQYQLASFAARGRHESRLDPYKS